MGFLSSLSAPSGWWSVARHTMAHSSTEGRAIHYISCFGRGEFHVIMYLHTDGSLSHLVYRKGSLKSTFEQALKGRLVYLSI